MADDERSQKKENEQFFSVFDQPFVGNLGRKVFGSPGDG